jgi:hypothetical protein
MKHILSMKSKEYEELENAIIKIIKSGWLATQEGKEAQKRFGMIDHRVHMEKI